MRILFITANRVGDAVLSTGLLDHLIRAHPDAAITVACGPEAVGVFARMPNRAGTIVLTKQRFNVHWARLWAWAVRRRWDLVVDIRGSALGWLVRTRARAAMRPRPGPKVAQLGAVLGLDPPPLPVAWTALEDRARAARLLPAGRPIVALGPTANWPGKLWPAERFATLFGALAAGALRGAVPVVLGGPGAAERAMAAPLLALLPEAVDLVGALSLPEAAACLARADLYVGSDSGLMHLAAAAGCATLGLFGPTPADEYAPAGPGAASVRAPDATMAGLTVEAVVVASERLLSSPRSAPCAGKQTAGNPRS